MTMAKKKKVKSVNARVAEHRKRAKADGKRQIAVQLSEQIIQKLDLIADCENASRADVIERLIENTKLTPIQLTKLING